MDFMQSMCRAVAAYRRAHDGRGPKRIVLSGDSAEAMVGWLSGMETIGCLLGVSVVRGFSGQSPEEKFLSGDVVYYKGIPVICRLLEDDELVCT